MLIIWSSTNKTLQDGRLLFVFAFLFCWTTPGHKGRRNRPGACLCGLVLFPRIRWVRKRGYSKASRQQWTVCKLLRWRLPFSATYFVDARVGPNGRGFAGCGNDKGGKNAGTSIKVARELRSKSRGNFDRSRAGPSIGSPACDPARAAYGAVYSARRGYNGKLCAFFSASPHPPVEKS
jgi:hypothetical protein